MKQKVSNFFSLQSLYCLLKDFVTLTKPRITFLVFFTSIAVIPIFLIDRFSLFRGIITSVSILFVSMGSATLNMVFEKFIDHQAKRTRNRPIPCGRISFSCGLVFGLVLITIGLVICSFISALATVFLLCACFLYSFVYTSGMKPLGVFPNLIGGFSGSAPPIIMHIAMMRGDKNDLYDFFYISLPLFLIINFWSCIHSWALYIALFKGKKDSSCFPWLSLTRGVYFTSFCIFLYTLVLVFLCISTIVNLSFLYSYNHFVTLACLLLTCALSFRILNQSSHIFFLTKNKASIKFIGDHCMSFFIYSIFFLFLYFCIIFFMGTVHYLTHRLSLA